MEVSGTDGAEGLDTERDGPGGPETNPSRSGPCEKGEERSVGLRRVRDEGGVSGGVVGTETVIGRHIVSSTH